MPVAGWWWSDSDLISLETTKSMNFTKGRGWLAAKERKDSGRAPLAFFVFLCGCIQIREP
jgi:hypothetical protein